MLGGSDLRYTRIIRILSYKLLVLVRPAESTRAVQWVHRGTARCMYARRIRHCGTSVAVRVIELCLALRGG